MANLRMYIIGPIQDLKQHSKEEIIEFYKQIAKICAQFNIDAFNPIIDQSGTPEFLSIKGITKEDPNYSRCINALDKKIIRMSHFVVKVTLNGISSDGGGIEQEFCRVAEVPLLLLSERQREANSDMVLGNCNDHLGHIFFESFDEALSEFKKALIKIAPMIRAYYQKMPEPFFTF